MPYKTDKDKLDSPYAFPYLDAEMNVLEQGMTLRDYFAAKAMAAIYGNAVIRRTLNYGNSIHPETVAINSYEMADAMLKARNNSSAD